MKQEILISILYDLLAGERVTLRGVAEKYGVSERTAYRYLESLSTANVPVWTERGRNGGFRMEEQYRLPAGFLTAEEADAVNDALAAVNAELGSEKLRSAMEKLKASSKNADTALTLTSGNLIIDAGHWGDASTYREKLARAEESIEKRLVVALKYHDRTGEYSRAGGCLPLPVPEDVPFYVKDYSEYYKGRAYHARSLNSNEGWNTVGQMSFMNQPILKYSNEIRSAVLVMHGEKAHSFYFGKDAFDAMVRDSKYTVNKEFLVIPGAVHTDLYDNLDVIPFDKMQKFFEENMK